MYYILWYCWLLLLLFLLYNYNNIFIIIIENGIHFYLFFKMMWSSRFSFYVVDIYICY